MLTYDTHRRRIAASNSQGTFVAPRMRTSPSFFPTPSIWTRNSVLIRRAESLSPSLLLLHKESTEGKREGWWIKQILKNIYNQRLLSKANHDAPSSMKMMAGASSLAISKRFRTRRSDSPCHLETRSAEETEKKVESASVATALARNDLPFV